MSLQKAVYVRGLGTYTWSVRKVDMGNGVVLTRRPIFQISAKAAQRHGLKQRKVLAVGDVRVVPVNFTALARGTPFDRNTVERCVHRSVQLLLRGMAAQGSIFTFAGMGVLSLCNGNVLMNFRKPFLDAVSTVERRTMQKEGHKPPAGVSEEPDRSLKPTAARGRQAGKGRRLDYSMPSRCCVPELEQKAQTPVSSRPIPLGSECAAHERAGQVRERPAGRRDQRRPKDQPAQRRPTDHLSQKSHTDQPNQRRPTDQPGQEPPRKRATLMRGSLFNSILCQIQKQEALRMTRKERVAERITRYETFHGMRESQDMWAHRADTKPRHREQTKRSFIRSSSHQLMDQCVKSCRKRRTTNC
ncbi:coiled-coil domain-containing protein 81-like [Amia ocellicauda]|uniref:coiled-coil domain-containing protein 81-like n=1 Tax=Amia ocellicauda TaxID=2972642 RepID=UPI0034648E8E